MPPPTREISLACPACGATAVARAGTRCPADGTVLISPDQLVRSGNDPVLGSVLVGKYAVFGVIGGGGMGTVYCAVQEPVGRHVAVKLIRRSETEAGGGDLRERFFREAQTVAQLHGPHTVTLFDFGSDDEGRLFMVLELVHGATLGQLIAGDGPLAVDEALEIAAQILEALSEAHAVGIVHRDIKPANLLIRRTPDGRPFTKVLDFGVAKVLAPGHDRLTATGMVVGSPLYLSPEQASAKPVGPAANQYSLACVLFEMLTGERPYNERQLYKLLSAHVSAPVPSLPERFDPTLNAVLRRALAKKPDERFDSAHHMRTALLATHSSSSSGGLDSQATLPGPLDAEEPNTIPDPIPNPLGPTPVMATQPDPITAPEYADTFIRTPEPQGPPPQSAAAGAGLPSAPQSHVPTTPRLYQGSVGPPRHRRSRSPIVLGIVAVAAAAAVASYLAMAPERDDDVRTEPMERGPTAITATPAPQPQAALTIVSSGLDDRATIEIFVNGVDLGSARRIRRNLDPGPTQITARAASASCIAEPSFVTLKAGDALTVAVRCEPEAAPEPRGPEPARRAAPPAPAQKAKRSGAQRPSSKKPRAAPVEASEPLPKKKRRLVDVPVLPE